MWVNRKDNSSILSVRIQPNSKKEGIGEIRNDALLIRLNAPAVEGRANEALIRFLSKALDIPKSRIAIVRGEKNRNKTVVIEGISPETVAGRFGLSL